MMKLNTLIFIVFFSIPLHALSIGSTESDVIRRFGPPPRRIQGPLGETWQYDNHHILIIQGRVEGYDNKEAFEIVLKPKRRSFATSLTPESSKDDVIKVLGTPDKIDRHMTYERWWYKGEVIEFIEDKIHIISNTQPLKFKFKQNPNAKPPMMHQRSTNDLIAKLGTPTTYRRGFNTDTWFYTNQFFIIQNDTVKYQDTWSPWQTGRQSKQTKTDFSKTEINKNLRVIPQNPRHKVTFPKPGIDDTDFNESDPAINYYYDSNQSNE